MKEWMQSDVTRPLRDQISDYVKEMIKKEVPGIPFEGYRCFRDYGSRKESEEAYFNVRKLLTAMGAYLQWNKPTDNEKSYFNELLWKVSNEFIWCLAAHLSYGEEGFPTEADKVIDLFSAETAATLSELLVLHKELIDPYIATHIKRQIGIRVIQPFLDKTWGWETSKSNWCAVCSGCIGIIALWLEQGDKREDILHRVDKAMLYYLNGFGEDGATEEGIGYWVYGFGYYIYYLALRKEQDPLYKEPEELRSKVRRIAEFPQYVQLAIDSYVPFSDAGEGVVIPTGLLSYLQREYGVKPPYCDQITSFDFDHCYRYAHISRNLWWTKDELFGSEEKDFSHYYQEKQWLTGRYGANFFAVKGGSNAEEHNHNDVGSFILAHHGELILTDLGAGPYTADYFGSRRYEYIHTRSYWHNLPLIQGKEQIPTKNRCEVSEVNCQGAFSTITMELSGLYALDELKSFQRCITSDLKKGQLTLVDEFIGSEELQIEEGFISTIRPVISEEGVLIWVDKSGTVSLRYDVSQCKVSIEEAQVNNHLGVSQTIYRVGLCTLVTRKQIRFYLEFLLA